MARYCLAAFILCAVIGFVGVRGQLDSCSVAVPAFLLTSDFNGLSCSNVWSTNNFILRHSLNDQKVLSIILSAKYDSGWVAIGFSQNGSMVGATAVVGWKNSSDSTNIKQFKLNGKSPSQVIADDGDIIFTGGNPEVSVQSGTIFLAFKMIFSGTIVNQQDLLFAYSTSVPVNDQLAIHNDVTAVRFNFTTGTASASSFWDSSHLRRTHGSLAIFAWGVLIPIGSIVARYCRRWDPLWYYLHAGIQFVGFFIALAAVVAGKLLFDKLHATFYSHRGIGLTVISFAVLQVLAIFLRPSKESKKRKYWNWYHHWIGRLAMLLAAINIVIGLRIGGAAQSMRIGYGFVLAITLATVIILEILLRTGCLRRNNAAPAF